MISRKVALVALATATVGVTAFSAQAARTPALAFGTPSKLGPWAGGEPSVAFDPSGNGAVYVVAPQGIPSGAYVALNALGEHLPTKGVGFWASYDHGRTFRLTANIGSAAGGGDSDVEVGADHTVYVADLEAAATSVCTSKDRGKSFQDASPLNLGCASITTNQSGPDNDRQWLSHGPKNVMYLTYHDFAANVPLMYRSTDKGQTFVPCGNILGSGPGQANFLPAVGGDLVAKPVVDQKDGSVYVTVIEPDQMTAVTSPQHYPLGSLYVAVARGGCTGTTSFVTHTVYSNPGADLAKDFNGMAEDGAGNLYVVAAGKLKAGQKANGVYVFTSRDHGTTWSRPQQVNTPNLTADALPAIAAGAHAGQVAVGWFGSSSSNDENYTKGQWRFYVAQSTSFGRSWTQTAVTKNVIHYGDICTQGLMCSLNPTGVGPYSTGDRNLADFSSLTYDPRTGKLLAVFPGDPWNRPDIGGNNDFSSATYVAMQR